MSEIQIVRTDKRQFITERNGYDDWRFAFWRELFQNSTDSGADRFTINMGIAPAVGAFGEEVEPHDVLRVEFTDNGCGMSRDVLDNVFFNIGTTTKGGNGSVGGFGTARQMLCFSQDCYQIHTGNLLVEGNGPRYAIHTLPDSYEPLSGCRFVIDIDQREPGWCKPNFENMEKALRDYLSYSQTPGVVALNGVRLTEKLLRGQARRTLVDESGQVFATAYTSEGKKARTGTLIVRQSGSAMFHTDIVSKGHIIVEIEQGWGRRVLNDKRSAMIGPYRRALDEFVQSVILDQRSAMSDKTRESITFVRGGLGAIHLRTPVEPQPAQEPGQTPDRQGANPQQVEAQDDEPSRVGGDLVRLAQEKGVKFNQRENIIPGMPDAVIQCQDLTGAADIAAASRRWNPENWGIANPQNGRRGLQMYQTLMAWTVACRQAADLLRASGAISKNTEFSIIPGWCFSKPGSDGFNALCQDLNDNRYAIMLNPVLPNGNAKFSLSSLTNEPSSEGGPVRHGLRSMAALACHEVAHIMSSYHGETYASTLTRMMEHMDQTAFCRRLQDAIRRAPLLWPAAQEARVEQAGPEQVEQDQVGDLGQYDPAPAM